MPGETTKVFLDYTQEEIDRAYDQRVWAPNAEEVMERYRRTSADLRRRLDCRADIAYGDSPEERLDFFPARATNAPVQIFIHGGAWRLLSKEESCSAAETFVRAGVHFVALNFANIPTVRLPDMVAQVRRAAAWIYRNARSLGADPDRIYVAGHSSGSHLTACVLVTDWQGEYGLPADLVKGGLCISGMYDLAPVMLSARSAYLQLSEAEIARFSPQRHLNFLNCPVVVAYGGLESPEFKRQARDFATALRKIDRLADFLLLPAANHFEMAESLMQPQGEVTQALFRMMSLSG